MSIQLGKGVAPPAKLKDIVHDLLPNETYDDKQLIFSAVKLSASQQRSLVYSTGFKPLHKYILYTIIPNNPLSQTLVSYVTKGDGYIYGDYFTVTNPVALDVETLKTSRDPVVLPTSLTFTKDNYLESYCCVKGTTVILGLSTDPSDIRASLQFTHDHKYYFNSMNESGLTPISKTKLTGLSKNLKHFHKYKSNRN